MFTGMIEIKTECICYASNMLKVQNICDIRMKSVKAPFDS